jgi:SsrA-binding protein
VAGVVARSSTAGDLWKERWSVGEEGKKVVATNRKARHEYEILDTFEAGLVLKGPEVKSLREGKVGFQDAFARVEGGEVWLHSLHISPYEQANRFNEDPLRPRKLLLHRQEILRLIGKVEEKGLTLVPLSIYFRRGYAKVTLALARGRKTYDKREKLKRKTQEDEARRAMDPYR